MFPAKNARPEIYFFTAEIYIFTAEKCVNFKEKSTACCKIVHFRRAYFRKKFYRNFWFPATIFVTEKTRISACLADFFGKKHFPAENNLAENWKLFDTEENPIIYFLSLSCLYYFLYLQ